MEEKIEEDNFVLSCTSLSASVEPIKPAPPVIKMVLFRIAVRVGSGTFGTAAWTIGPFGIHITGNQVETVLSSKNLGNSGQELTGNGQTCRARPLTD